MATPNTSAAPVKRRFRVLTGSTRSVIAQQYAKESKAQTDEQAEDRGLDS
jgi:hypothetical protein